MGNIPQELWIAAGRILPIAHKTAFSSPAFILANPCSQRFELLSPGFTFRYLININMQIKDHVVIVTGASSGIGRSTAIALSGAGANLPFLNPTGANESASLRHLF
jgi:hypothetical protein